MSFGLTDASPASAVELRALQVAVVTRVMRVVLVVGVVPVVLALLDNIVSRTSSKHNSTMLIVSQETNREERTEPQPALVHRSRSGLNLDNTTLNQINLVLVFLERLFASGQVKATAAADTDLGKQSKVHGGQSGTLFFMTQASL